MYTNILMTTICTQWKPSQEQLCQAPHGYVRPPPTHTHTPRALFVASRWFRLSMYAYIHAYMYACVCVCVCLFTFFVREDGFKSGHAPGASSELNLHLISE
jgi:hypothetical protein